MDLLKVNLTKPRRKTANWRELGTEEVPRMQQRPGGTHGTGPWQPCGTGNAVLMADDLDSPFRAL